MTTDKILIVDDESNNVDILNKYLRRAGFQILVATDGETALERINYIKPDIILLDIKMPGIDGFETLRRLQAHEAAQDIPVIFLTAAIEATDKVKGFELGAMDYITKPFQIDEVLARVNVHLTNRRLQQKLHNQNIHLQQEIVARQQAEAALQDTHDKLEQRVKERTTELDEAITLLQQEIRERQQAQAETQHLLTTLEQRIADRTREISTFFDLTILAGRANNLTEAFQQATPRIIEVTRSRVICIHLLDPDQPGLNLAVHQNLPNAAVSVVQKVELSGPFQQWLFQPGAPLVTTNLPALNILPSALRLDGFDSYLGAPIKVGSRSEGLLSCYRFTNSGFGLDEISLVVALAEQIGIMLENHRLRQKTGELAVLEERQRLARELHDSVTQSIFSLTLFTRSALEAAEDGDSSRLATSLTEIQQSAHRALQEMRLLLYELHPPQLEEVGLTGAIENRLNQVERRAGLQVDFLANLKQVRLPHTVEVELYWLVIEALNNIVKHAKTSHVSVNLSQNDNQIMLDITDYGVGFDLHQKSGGFGLRGMRERIGRLKGQFDINTAPGQGTQISIKVDLNYE